MNSRIFIFMIVVAGYTQTFAQSEKSNFYVGLDVVKPFMAVAEQGYILEPSLSFKMKDQTMFHLVLGKASVNCHDVFDNLDYQANGYYIKAGVGARIRKFFEPSFSLGYSNFTETGKTTFSGPYYGDWTGVLRQKQDLFFVEAQVNFWIKISERFYIVPNARFAYFPERPRGTKFPSYYVPGAGYVLIDEFSATDDNGMPKSNLLTGGISVRLVYTIF